jgi:hypothetical protein
MIHHVFAIYDSKLRAFFPPWLAVNPQIGRRMFSTGANDPESQLSHHPEDFTLFEIAKWDDELGVYEPRTPHINHGLAANYREHDHEAQQKRNAAPVLAGPQGGDPALNL